MSFVDKLSSGIDVVAEKVEGNKHLRAIKDAFTAYMPFIIIGSFALLFNVVDQPNYRTSPVRAVQLLDRIGTGIQHDQFRDDGHHVPAHSFIFGLKSCKKQ